MPRTRELKPAFFQDEFLAALGRDHRLLFAALWTLADREGRLEDRPAFIRINFCPYDEDMPPSRVSEMLGGLETAGFIRRYQVSGKGYILVKNLKKNQHIHPKEAASVIPPPPNITEPIRELPGTTGKSKSSQGILPLPSEPSFPSGPSLPSGSCDETPVASSPPTLLTFPCDGEPKQWGLTKGQVDHWGSLFPSLDIMAECRAALAWCEANPSKRKTAGGMPRALVAWFGRSQNRGNGQHSLLPKQQNLRTGHARAEDFNHDKTGEIDL
jgi:hypothetical protein